jgi:hypothetical protein
VLFEVFEKLTSSCLSKFHEKPSYYLLIIYIKVFETIKFELDRVWESFHTPLNAAVFILKKEYFLNFPRQNLAQFWLVHSDYRKLHCSLGSTNRRQGITRHQKWHGDFRCVFLQCQRITLMAFADQCKVFSNLPSRIWNWNHRIFLLDFCKPPPTPTSSIPTLLMSLRITTFIHLHTYIHILLCSSMRLFDTNLHGMMIVIIIESRLKLWYS